MCMISSPGLAAGWTGMAVGDDEISPLQLESKRLITLLLVQVKSYIWDVG